MSLKKTRPSRAKSKGTPKPKSAPHPETPESFNPANAIIAEDTATLLPSRLAWSDGARGLFLYHGGYLEVMNAKLANEHARKIGHRGRGRLPAASTTMSSLHSIPRQKNKDAKNGTALLRWAGSKRQIVDDLLSYWPPLAKRYVEPFCGSACLFFHKKPKAAVLGDINKELIFAYQTIRRMPQSTWRQFRRIRPNKREYYRIRGQSPALLSASQRSARFLFLNRYCFNGLFRTNRAGNFNVPYGGRKQAQLHSKDLRVASELLKRATLVTGDFEKTLRRVRPRDFVYLDPPYALESRRIFSEYDRNAFAIKDLNRLSDELGRIDHLGAWFLLSYADTPATRARFSEWFTRRMVTRRNIAGFAGHRRNSYELLVANFPLPKP